MFMAILLWYESGPVAPQLDEPAPAASSDKRAGREPTPPRAMECPMPTTHDAWFLRDDQPIPCLVCKQLLNGLQQYEKHITGKRHKQNEYESRRGRPRCGYNKIGDPDEQNDAQRAYTHAEPRDGD